MSSDATDEVEGPKEGAPTLIILVPRYEADVMALKSPY
jgi:hypothetical protein